MIRVLVVEDSPVVQEFLTYILDSDPDIRVVGVAPNGMEALDCVEMLRPDVITMDIHMPIMDGFEVTRRIMETVPTPIVIVSGSTGATELASTFRALEAGALAVISRPPGLNHTAFDEGSKELILTVKLMSEIKVVRRFARKKPAQTAAPAVPAREPGTASGIRIIAIGASTGGPPVLKEILSGLSKNSPSPCSSSSISRRDSSRAFRNGSRALRASRSTSLPTAKSLCRATDIWPRTISISAWRVAPASC